MNTSKQPARMQYENAYRHFRCGEERQPGGIWDLISTEVERAADYSYQAKDYEVHGWFSDARRKRFYQIFWRVVTARGELPF